MIGNFQWLTWIHTGYLLLTIAGNSADDGILLAAKTVERTIGVSLDLSGFILSLPGGVFLLAGLGP